MDPLQSLFLMSTTLSEPKTPDGAPLKAPFRAPPIDASPISPIPLYYLPEPESPTDVYIRNRQGREELRRAKALANVRVPIRVPDGGASALDPDMPDTSKFTNLLRLIEDACIPRIAEPYRLDRLKATRKPTKKDIQLKLQLRYIVPDPDLVAQLAPATRQRLKPIKIDMKDAIHLHFVHRVHPYFSSKGLPGVIQSEKDSEGTANQTITRPSTLVCSAVLLGRIPRNRKEERYPFCVSAISADIQPDICTMCRGQGGQASCKGNHITEVKTNAILKAPGLGTNPLHEAQEASRKYPGHAIRYEWARNATQAQRLNTESRIIAQVSRSGV